MHWWMAFFSRSVSYFLHNQSPLIHTDVICLLHRSHGVRERQMEKILSSIFPSLSNGTNANCIDRCKCVRAYVKRRNEYKSLNFSENSSFFSPRLPSILTKLKRYSGLSVAVDILSVFFRFACSEYGCQIIMLHLENTTNLALLLLVDDDQRVYVIKIFSKRSQLHAP